MRRLLIASLFVIAGLTNSAHAVGIAQERWQQGCALSDVMCTAEWKHQQEEIARSTTYGQWQVPSIFKNFESVGRSILPGGLGALESFGRTLDSSRKTRCLRRTLIAGQCELTGSAPAGGEDGSIKFQFRAYPGW